MHNHVPDAERFVEIAKAWRNDEECPVRTAPWATDGGVLASLAALLARVDREAVERCNKLYASVRDREAKDRVVALVRKLGPSFHLAMPACEDADDETSSVERDDTGECVVTCMYDEYASTLLELLNALAETSKAGEKADADSK